MRTGFYFYVAFRNNFKTKIDINIDDKILN